MAIPEGLVLIDPSFVDILLIAVTALAIIIIIFIIGLVISKVRTPAESNQIKEAKNRGYPLMLCVGLSHFADIFHVKDFIPEGVVQRIKGRGERRTQLRFNLAKNQKLPKLEVGPTKRFDLTREAFLNLIQLAKEKVFLRGARVPLLGAVEDKAVAVGLKALGAMAFYEKLEKLPDLKEKIELLKTITKDSEMEVEVKGEKLKIPKKIEFSDVAEVLEGFLSKVSFIDFEAIRTNFVDAIYDQTTGESISDRDTTIGRREAGKGMDTFKQWLPFIILLIIAICGGIGIIIAAGALAG